MPATKNPTTSLHEQLITGLSCKSRADGSVHSIRGKDDSTVAEICCGKRATRINFRQIPAAKLTKGVKLTGRSKSWPGGGIVVTAANVTVLRSLLVGVVGTAAKPAATKAAKPAAEPVPKAPAAIKPGGDTNNDSRSTAPHPPATPTKITVAS